MGTMKMLNTDELLKRFEDSESLSVNDLAKFVPIDEARWAVNKLVDMDYIEDAKIEWHMGYAQIDHDAIQYRISLDGRQHLQELEQLAQKMTDDDAKADAKDRAQQIQARRNEKKLFRHDFKVAAFTVILTLGLEHIADIVNFIKRMFEAISSVFH